MNPERLYVTWFTSAADGYNHAVTDEEAARGFRTRTDATAVCDHTVTPTPMITPPGPHCPHCLNRLARHAQQQIDLPRPRRRGPSWLRRLVSHEPPAGRSNPHRGPRRA